MKESMFDNMNEYKNAVTNIAAKGENNLLHNAGNDHALIIFENIFKNAQKEILISARDLTNSEVSNKEEYINSLLSFLDHNADSKLYILVSDFQESYKNFDLYKKLANSIAYKENRIKIKNSNGFQFTSGGITIHFCVADNRMYRLETDVQKRTAICNFGDEETANKLANAFWDGFNAETSDEVTLI